MSKKKSVDTSFLKYTGLAFQMGITIFLGAFAGKKLDNYLSLNKPYFTAALAFVGVIVSFYFLFKDLSQDKKNEL